MPNFTAGTSFTDGVTNDVTAAKLNALVADAVPTSSLSLNSTTGTIATFNSTTGTIATLNSTTGTIATGVIPNLTSSTATFGTTTSTAATITSGTITNLASTTGTIATLNSTTPTFLGAITASTNTINVGSGQIYKDSSGNVGVGTTSPTANLHVVKTTSQTDIDSATQAVSIVNTASDTNGNLTGIRLRQDNATNVAQGYIGLSSTGSLATRANLIIATPNTSGNSTERLRIDSSGNVGIGETSPAAKLHVAGTSPVIFNRATSTGASYLNTRNDNNDFYIGVDDASGAAFGKANAAIIWGASAQPIVFATSGTERLRIDSSGNVGIGSTNPTDTNNFGRSLDIRSSTGAAAYFRDSDDASKYSVTGFFGADSNAYLGSWGASTGAVIYTSGTERLRITSGGEVYIAGTTDQGAYNLQVNGTGVWGAGAYVNGSDSRIKEDIQPLTSGLDVVEKLNPVTYKYKETWSSDQSIQSGFIAQELLMALDGQIYVDGVVQQGGSEGYYSVAYQNLIAVLTKAIQELKSENDSLKDRVSALEAA